MDLDSLPLEVHGHQAGSAVNGYYGYRCFHPLIVSWEFGDFLGAMLREGNVHTSEDALEFVQRFLSWAAQFAERVWLRMDAGFPSEPFLAGLEAHDYRYMARLKTNSRLEKMAWPHVDRIAEKAEPDVVVVVGIERTPEAVGLWVSNGNDLTPGRPGGFRGSGHGRRPAPQGGGGSSAGCRSWRLGAWAPGLRSPPGHRGHGSGRAPPPSARP